MIRANSWTEKEIKYLRRHHGKKSYAEIAKKIGRSELAVKTYAVRLGIVSSRGFTPEQVRVLVEKYPHHPSAQVAKEIGRKLDSVYRKANALGLKKSEEYLKSEECGRLFKGHRRSVGTEFKKGLTPWNKGMKGLQVGGKQTQFKKGNLPHNHKPVGTEAVVDGYIKVKIGEPNVWEHKHRLVWEQHHGPIPEGGIVRFLDKNTMNCDIRNLVMIDRIEHALRNGRHKIPDEVIPAAYALAKLRRGIRNYEKQNG